MTEVATGTVGAESLDVLRASAADTTTTAVVFTDVEGSTALLRALGPDR